MAYNWTKAELMEKMKEILEQYPDDAEFLLDEYMSDDGHKFMLEAVWGNAPEVEKFSHQERVIDPRTGESYYITVSEYLEKR